MGLTSEAMRSTPTRDGGRLISAALTVLLAATLLAAAPLTTPAHAHAQADGAQQDRAQQDGAQSDEPAIVLAPPPADGPTAEGEDGTSVTLPGVREFVGDVPVEQALSASTQTFLRADQVLIARDDEFADTLASALLQGRPAPLLLVPGSGPLPPAVASHIQDLGASSAVILGGTAAVAPAVADELAGLGLEVTRLAGADRIATAVAIAEHHLAQPDVQAPQAILARGYASGEDPTQAWADSIAAGGWSAADGLPILLTATDALSPATAAHLQAAGYVEVVAVGGTAAISEAVLEQVRALGVTVTRVAGADRYDTAVQVVLTRQPQDGEELLPAVVASGDGEDGWVAGLTAAAFASTVEARVLTVPGEAPIPEGTRQVLGLADASESRQGLGFIQQLLYIEAVARRQLQEALLGRVLGGATPGPHSFTLLDEDGTPCGDRCAQGVRDEGTMRFRLEAPDVDHTRTSALLANKLDPDSAEPCDPITPVVTEGEDELVVDIPLDQLACLDVTTRPTFPHGILLRVFVSAGPGRRLSFNAFRSIVPAAPAELAIASFTADGSAVHLLRGGEDVPLLVDDTLSTFAIDAHDDVMVVTTDDFDPTAPPQAVRIDVPANLVGEAQVDGAREVLWTADGDGVVNNPSISPDGAIVGFGWEAEPGSGDAASVRTIAVDGSDAGTSTVVDDDGAGCLADQAWSADGQLLHWWLSSTAVSPDRDRGTAGPPDADDPTRLYDGGTRPAVSPDGILADIDGDGRTVILHDTTTGETTRTFGSTRSAASWNPDGTRFAVLEASVNGLEMAIYDRDGQFMGGAALTRDGVEATGVDSPPEWGPDGRIAVPASGAVAVYQPSDDPSQMATLLALVEVPGVDEVVDVAWF